MKLILAVGKAAALFLLAVLAFLTVEPEPAELSLDLFLPAIFVLDVLGLGVAGHLRLSADHVRVAVVVNRRLESSAHLEAVEAILI